MNRKPDPAVFLRAAELIESGAHFFACYALENASIDQSDVLGETPEYALFAKYYAPKWIERGIWFNGFFTQWRRARALRRCAKIAAQLNSQSQ